MLKDRVIYLNNNNSYYILEEIEYDYKKYVFAAKCDLEKETINEDEYVVKEIKLVNNELVTENILDDNLALCVTNLLLEKIRNN